MTKRDAFLESVKRDGITEYSVDYALPQEWVDQVVKETPFAYDQVTGNFLWIYTDKLLFGAPYPISCFGRYMSKQSKLFQ